MRKSLLLSFIIFSFFLSACSSVAKETEDKTEITISAAISLTDALEEIKTLYKAKHEVDLTYNFGGSGSLAQQIEQGAPVDVFISANEDWLDKLAEKDLIINDTRFNLTGNQLVMIAAKETFLAYTSFADLTHEEVGDIAIGNPESVPAGQYAEEALRNLNLWDSLVDSFVFAKDVRQVLTYVETGNVDIGFIYESDALLSDNVTILAYADENSHEAILYPLAVMKDAKNLDAAKEFAEYLQSTEAQEVLAKYGFKNR